MSRTRKKYTPIERARKGGYARAAKLTKRQLSDQGRKAVIIRWARAKGLLEAPGSPFAKAGG